LGNTSSNAVFLLLVRLVPPRLAPIPLLAGRTRRQLRDEALWCLGVVALLTAAVTPLATLWLLAGPRYVLSVRNPFLTWNYLATFAIELAGVVFLVMRLGGSTRDLGLTGIAGRWRWIGPGVFVLVYAGLILWFLLFSVLGRGRGHDVSIGTLAFTWVFVILAAAFPEEFLFRVLLQTRLEALLGRWNGIALAALAFGLFHFPARLPLVWLPLTHGSLAPAVLFTVASVVTVQGSVGVMWGYLWSRYRNAWLQVLLHTLTDGIGFTLIVAGLLTRIQ
jgi:membrane protease YdiL (CAAX protease family)